MLTWSASLDRDALVADGYDVVEFSALGPEIAAATRRAGRRRSILSSSVPLMHPTASSR